MYKTNLKPAFGWIGGKSKLTADIIKVIPQHTHYIEVFGGSLALLYAKDKSDVEIVNDINDHLVNLHRCIRSNHRSLNIYLQNMTASRSGFKQIKLALHRRLWKNKVHRAAMYYYMLVLSFGAKGEHIAMPKTRHKNIYKSFKIHSQRLHKGINPLC